MVTVPGTQEDRSRKGPQERGIGDVSKDRSRALTQPERGIRDGFNEPTRSLDAPPRNTPDEAARLIDIGARLGGVPLDIIKKAPERFGALADKAIYHPGELDSIYIDIVRQHPLYADMTRESIPQIHDLSRFIQKPMSQWPLPEKTMVRMADVMAMDVPLVKQVPRVGATFAAIERVSFTAAEDPESAASIRQEASNRFLAQLREEEEFLDGLDKVTGFGLVTRRFQENPTFFLPFIGQINDLEKVSQLYFAAKAIETGTPTEGQVFLLYRYGRIAEALELRGADVFAKTASIIAEAVPMVGEFILTGGTATAVERVVMKATGELVESYIKRVVQKVLRNKLTAWVAGSVAQLPLASPAKIASGVLERMKPMGAADVDPQGRPVFHVVPGTGKSFFVALHESVAEQFAEIASERISGSLLPDKWQRLLGGMTDDLIGQGKSIGSFAKAQELLRKGGIGSFFAELGEEEAATLIRLLAGSQEVELADMFPEAVGGNIKTDDALSIVAATAIMTSPGTMARTFGKPQETTPESIRARQRRFDNMDDLRDKSPEVIDDMMDRQAKGQEAEFYNIPVEFHDKYWQDKTDEEGVPASPDQMARDLGVTREELEEARNSVDGVIRFKSRKFHQTLGKTEHAEAYFQEITEDRNDMSKREFKEWTEREEKRVKKETAEVKKEVKAGAVVRRNVRQQAEATGMDTIEARNNAELITTFYQTIGKQAGMTAQELFKEQPLKIVGPKGGFMARAIAKAKAAVTRKPKTVAERERADVAVEPGAENIINVEDILGGPPPRGEALSQGKRGFIEFMKGGGARITLKTDADHSTLAHEASHMYVELTGRMVASGRANEELNKTFDALLNFLGTTRPEWFSMTFEGRRALHEKLAKGYEQWLFEGKAPTPELARTFKNFADLMRTVYLTSEGLGIKLDPAVREGYARLHAVQEELGAAEREFNAIPVVPDVKAGLTQAEADALSLADTKRRAELYNKVLEGKLKEFTKEQKKKEAVIREEVAAEVQAEPVYIAFANMSRGLQPNGDPLPEDEAPIKLSRADIVADFPVIGIVASAKERGEARANSLPRSIMTREPAEGMYPDHAAQLFTGFSSGEQLLDEIFAMEPMQERIDRLTRERVQVDPAISDILKDPLVLHDSVMQALHNEERGGAIRAQLKFLMREHQAQTKSLFRRIALRIPSNRDVKDDAKAFISSRPASDLRPVVYERMARTAARKAVVAFNKGNFAEAFEHKVRELVAHERTRATRKAVKERDALEKRIRKANKTDIQKALVDAQKVRVEEEGKPITFTHPYRDALNDILNRLGDFLRAGRAAPPKDSLSMWVAARKAEAESTNPESAESIVPDWMTAPGAVRERREYTLEELRDIANSIKNIIHQAKTRVDPEFLAKKKNIKTTMATALPEQIEFPRVTEEASFWFRVKGWGAWVRDYHSRFNEFTKIMDGGADTGPAQQALSEPIQRAANEKVRLKVEFGRKVEKIWKKRKKAGGRPMHKKLYIPEMKRSLSVGSLSSLFMNWGNLGNRERVTGGPENWTPEQVVSAINRLDKPEMQWAQDTLDIINEFRDRNEALGERILGVKPIMVEAEPIITLHGEFAGGYYPIDYASHLPAQTAAEAAAKQRQEDAEILNEAQRANVWRMSTSVGHLQKRTRSNGRPINLSPSVATNHLQDVIHALTHHEMVIEVNRLLSALRPEIESSRGLGPTAYDEMRSTLSDLAIGHLGPKGTGRNSRMAQNTLHWIATARALSVLSIKPATAILQFFGYGNSVVALGGGVTGVRWMMQGLMEIIRDFPAMIQLLKSNPFMANRITDMDREINDIHNALRGKGKIRASLGMGMFMARFAQYFLDVNTFMGAYMKFAAAARESKDPRRGEELHEHISLQAQQIVIDSQGSGRVGDLAGILRSRWLKPLTLFMGYFIARGNLSRRVFRSLTPNPLTWMKAGVDMMFLYPLPTAASFLLIEILRGEDDEEKLAEGVARDVLTDPLNDYVLLRELAGPLRGIPYRGEAGFGGVSDVTNALLKTGDFAMEGELPDGFMIAWLKVLGTFTGLPSTQVSNMIRGNQAAEDGEGSFGSRIFGPPR